MTEYTILTPNDIYEIERRCNYNKESTDQIKRIFRDQPQGILSAYDTYKGEIPLKAIAKGEQVPMEELTKVLAWKQDILDLKSDAFANIPEEVAYYYTKYKR